MSIIMYDESMEYLTVQQAAVKLGVSVRGVRERIKRGDMKAERLGPRLWAIPRDEVERWRGRGKLRPGPKSRKERAGDGG